MSTFRWRLQRVLDIRQKQMQLLRAELSALTVLLGRKRCELMLQKKMLENLIEKLQSDPPRRRLEQQAFFLRYSEANDSAIRRLEGEIKQLSEQQKKKEAELARVEQFTDALQRLRTRAEEEFAQKQEISEQKQQDEETAFRFARLMQLQQAAPE
ncbi:MAG TPA: hypothetical protein PK052_02165 [Anaerohalosphaeraceae bacterium]|nr:hypothetical protein [Phycisphaerae bacterium]HOK94934.1 hypothetical protein [Anaerohalosphaeraceae bacterium]HOL30760.1 hypothetical protein [Anaerohalosphaeraceae bacterium]HOM75425.1 hypothetical protein [Anaerohalosphaeraceae bacterium]HPC63015.1 hypothetical protein [Anaerohalosphaeraceae bacterium]